MTGEGRYDAYMSDAETDDDTLVRAFRKGDARAMEILVSRHGAVLLAYMRARSTEADDIVQETWYRAIQRIGRFRSGNFRAWLMTIARNCMIDRLRRGRLTISLDADDGDGQGLAGRLTGDMPDAPEQMESRETHERIMERVMALPPDQREVFLLRTRQELSFAEIARLLDIPLNTALGRMHYAVTKLRRELGMDDEENRR